MRLTGTWNVSRRAEEIIDRALTAPLGELQAVQDDIRAFLRDPEESEEDKVRVATAGETVAMRLEAMRLEEP
jgi:hypothetical protein